MSHVKLEDAKGSPNMTEDLFKLIDGPNQGSGEKKGRLFSSFWKRPMIGRRSIEREFEHHALDGPSYSAESEHTEGETNNGEAEEAWHAESRDDVEWGFNDSRGPDEAARDTNGGFPPLVPKGEGIDSIHKRHLNPKVLVNRTPKKKRENNNKRPKEISLTQLISQSFDSEAGSESSGHRQHKKLEGVFSMDDSNPSVYEPPNAYAQLSPVGDATEVTRHLAPGYQNIQIRAEGVKECEQKERHMECADDARDTEIDANILSFKDRLAFYKTKSAQSFSSDNSQKTSTVEDKTDEDTFDSAVSPEELVQKNDSAKVETTSGSKKSLNKPSPLSLTASEETEASGRLSVLERIKKIQGVEAPESRPSSSAMERQSPTLGDSSRGFSVARLSISSNDSKGTIRNFSGKRALPSCSTRFVPGKQTTSPNSCSLSVSSGPQARNLPYADKKAANRRSNQASQSNQDANGTPASIPTLAQRRAAFLSGNSLDSSKKAHEESHNGEEEKKSGGTQIQKFINGSFKGQVSGTQFRMPPSVRQSVTSANAATNESVVVKSYDEEGSFVKQNLKAKCGNKVEKIYKPPSFKALGVNHGVPVDSHGDNQSSTPATNKGKTPLDLGSRVKSLRMSMECNAVERLSQDNVSVGTQDKQKVSMDDDEFTATTNENQGKRDSVALESGCMTLAERKKAFTSNFEGNTGLSTSKRFSASSSESTATKTQMTSTESRKEKSMPTNSTTKLSKKIHSTNKATTPTTVPTAPRGAVATFQRRSATLQSGLKVTALGGPKPIETRVEEPRDYSPTDPNLIRNMAETKTRTKRHGSVIANALTLADRKKAFLPKSPTEDISRSDDRSAFSQGDETVSGVSTDGRMVLLRRSMTHSKFGASLENQQSENSIISRISPKMDASACSHKNAEKQPGSSSTKKNSISVTDLMRAFDSKVVPSIGQAMERPLTASSIPSLATEKTLLKAPLKPSLDKEDQHCPSVKVETNALTTSNTRTSLAERKKAFEANFMKETDDSAPNKDISVPRRSLSLPKARSAPQANSSGSNSATALVKASSERIIDSAVETDEEINPEEDASRLEREVPVENPKAFPPGLMSIVDGKKAFRPSIVSNSASGDKTAAMFEHNTTMRVNSPANLAEPFTEGKEEDDHQQVEKEDFASKLQFFTSHGPVVTKSNISRPHVRSVVPDDPSVASTRLETTSLGDYTIGGHPIYVVVDDNCMTSECLSPSPRMLERKVVCGPGKGMSYFEKLESFNASEIPQNEEALGMIATLPPEGRTGPSTEERYNTVKNRFSQKALPWRQQNAAGRYLERKRHTISDSETTGRQLGIKLPTHHSDIFCPISQCPVDDRALLGSGMGATENRSTAANTPVAQRTSSTFKSPFGTPTDGYNYGSQ